jgi:hypothetical protein
MIVGLLKNRTQVSIFSLLIIGVSLFAYNLAISQSFKEIYNIQDNLLYKLIFGDFNNTSIWYTLFNFVLISLGALIINLVSINSEVVSKENLLPAFFYFIFSFSAITSNQLQPILISNLFIMLSLHYLYNSYRIDNALSDLFNVGFLMSMGCCFYTYYVLIVALGVIGLFILKSFNWREWLCFVLGVVLPLLLFMSFAYLNGSDFLRPFSLFSNALKHINTPVFSEYYLVLSSSFIFLILLSIGFYFKKGFGSRVKIQKAKFILIWLGVLCLIISFLDTTSTMFLLPCAIPFSIIIGDYIGEIKQLKVANTLLSMVIFGFAIICMHNLGVI